MLFLPHGQRKGEVVDPANFTREYQHALRLINRTTHYQWGQAAGSTFDTAVVVSTTYVHVDLGGTSSPTQEGDKLQLRDP